MNYQVAIKEIAPVKAIFLRFVTNMAKIAADMQEKYMQVWQAMESAGTSYSADYCFAIYHCESSSDFDPNHIDVECGFPVKEQGNVAEPFVCRTVEGGLFASTLHKGPYRELEGAYCAIIAWAEENDYELLAGWRDYYLNDPDQVSEEEMLTEVACPIRKK